MAKRRAEMRSSNDPYYAGDAERHERLAKLTKKDAPPKDETLDKAAQAAFSLAAETIAQAPARPRPPVEQRHSPMIDDHVVRGWLQRITYKPDTRFTVRPYFGYAHHESNTTIRVDRQLPDSVRPAPRSIEEFTDSRFFIPVGCDLPVPTQRLMRLPVEVQFAAFFEWLHRRVIWLERHEIDEWFRVDGTLPFDPHSGEGRAEEATEGTRIDFEVPGHGMRNGRLRKYEQGVGRAPGYGRYDDMTEFMSYERYRYQAARYIDPFENPRFV